MTELDDYLRAASVLAWLGCATCLLPAVWRLLKRQGPYLDPVWAIVFLLGLNRLSFLLALSAEISHLTAAILALTMAWFSRWYQRHDA